MYVSQWSLIPDAVRMYLWLLLPDAVWMHPWLLQTNNSSAADFGEFRVGYSGKFSCTEKSE